MDHGAAGAAGFGRSRHGGGFPRGRGGFEPAVQIAREDAAEREKETGDDK